MEAAEARVRELDGTVCPHCGYRVERDFIRCPSCLRKLKERCTSCGRPLDQAWTICPYCEADVPPASASRRTRRARGAASAAKRGEFGAPATAGGRLVEEETHADLAPLGPPGADAGEDAPGSGDDAEPIVRPASARGRGRPGSRPES
jgi:hypothetical protein